MTESTRVKRTLRGKELLVYANGLQSRTAHIIEKHKVVVNELTRMASIILLYFVVMFLKQREGDYSVPNVSKHDIHENVMSDRTTNIKKFYDH